MAYFWKTLGLVLVGVILWLVVDKREKDLSVLLTLGVCCCGAGAAAVYLREVLDFMAGLGELGGMNSELMGLMWKAAGIGMITEITGSLCTDAGNSSMAGVVRLLGSSAILYVSLPALETLTEMVQDIMGVL